MTIPESLLSPAWLGSAAALSLGLIAAALWRAPWRRLREGEHLHVWLGTGVALMVLWRIEAGIAPGLSFHFLGASLATLMFGPSLALLCLSLVVVAVSFSVAAPWQGVPWHILLTVAVPVTITVLVHRAALHFLPHHLFIYLFVSGFFAAALALAASGTASAVVYALSGAYALEYLREHYLPFYLLMVFPEAILTGSMLSLLTVYRPQWIASYDEDTYLKGK